MREDSFRSAVMSMLPVIYAVSWEEQRVEQSVIDIASKSFKTPVPVYKWSAAVGIVDPEGNSVPDTHDPAQALSWVVSHGKTAFYIFRDLNRWWDDPLVVRRVRDIYRGFSGSFKRFIIVSPRLEIPFELEKEVQVFDFPLPSVEDLDQVFESARASYEKLYRKNVAVDEHIKNRMINAALGLTGDEARNAFYTAMSAQLDAESVATVLREKHQLTRKSGVLEFVEHNFGIDDLGGLENLKEWLRKRSVIFKKEARDAGLSSPKGVLMTGISGCGKSLCVQAIAAYWNLPLIRLDLNLVYAGIINNPEETLERALRVAETVAPCVLWIDEIEKGVSRTPTGAALGPPARIFSRFLTWMQEKEGMVFTAATANEIDLLAPEFLRKGRFDEIFFVDLPSESERAEIFAVHLKKRKQDLNAFNLTNLAKASRNFSGSEIEQAVVAGMFEAFDGKKQLTEQDIYTAIGKTIPLATTMAEDIKKIKRWALDRAVKASK